MLTKRAHSAVAALAAFTMAAGAGCSKIASLIGTDTPRRKSGESGGANRPLTSNAVNPARSGPAALPSPSAWIPSIALPRGQAVLPLKVNGRLLVDQRNVPFLIHGDAPWSLIAQLTRDEVDVYLEDRRRRGVNFLVVNLLEHKFAARAPRNAYGDGPFTTDGDFSTPNEPYFAHADWVLRRAGLDGFVVLLAPAYLGYNGGDEGFYQEMTANGVDRLRAYGRFVGDRYKELDNIVWLEGGDYTPPPEGAALVDAVANGIKERDGRHLHAAHWAPERSGADLVCGWLDLDTTYTYQPVYLKSLADDSRDSNMPHFLLESTYEGERQVTQRGLRAQAYYALLSGAVGQIFGNGVIWKFDPGWRSALDSPGMRSMVHVRELFAPRAWHTLVPDRRSETLVAGQGAFGSADYALLARSSDGRLAIAYIPDARDVTIDMGRLAAPVTARWFDPSSGAFSDIQGSPFSGTGQVVFHPSGPNHDGDSDWVLVLEAT